MSAPRTPLTGGAPAPGEAVAAASRGRTARTWERLSRNPTLGLLALLLVMWVLAWIFVPKFGSADNIRTVLRQASDLSVAATGILFVLLIGGIDLSVGALYGLTSVLLVTVMIQTGSLPLALAVALGAGVLFGLVNGWLVQWIRIPAFITTLGGYYIAFALAQIDLSGQHAQDAGLTTSSWASRPASSSVASPTPSPTWSSWPWWWGSWPGWCSTTRVSGGRSWPSATTA